MIHKGRFVNDRGISSDRVIHGQPVKQGQRKDGKENKYIRVKPKGPVAGGWVTRPPPPPNTGEGEIIRTPIFTYLILPKRHFTLLLGDYRPPPKKNI